MTIFQKVIGSAVAPLLLYFNGMLPSAQAIDTTEKVQIVNVNALSAQDYLVARTQNVSRAKQRITLAKNVVNTGKQYIGVHYCHGGISPRCFDCSGFTKFVYKKNGIYLPRTADAQLSRMKVISKKDAKAGDLVFFINRGGYAYHVGIYIGNNRIMHSPKPGRRVKYENIWTSRVVFATIR
jgi:cell wall-associated NlpC family hydrolase